MQEQMLGGKGFLVIGYLLEKVSDTYCFFLIFCILFPNTFSYTVNVLHSLLLPFHFLPFFFKNLLIYYMDILPACIISVPVVCLVPAEARRDPLELELKQF